MFGHPCGYRTPHDVLLPSSWRFPLLAWLWEPHHPDDSQLTISDKNGNNITVKAADGGGAVTLLARENPNLDQNTILIDPSIQSQATVLKVTPAYYLSPVDPANGNRFESVTIKQGINDVTFHEIGHVIYQGKSQNKVIDYHNKSRNSLLLTPRPYDEHHNKNVKRGVYWYE